MNDKRIYTSLKGLLTIFLPVYFVAAFIFYLIVGVTFPPTTAHYLVVVGWTIITVIYIIYGYKNSYYVLTKHELTHHKGGQVLHYPYKDIVYIDEKYSNKKLNIRFVTRQGHERYLTHDKGRIVYKAMLERAINRLTYTEFINQYPKVKL